MEADHDQHNAADPPETTGETGEFLFPAKMAARPRQSARRTQDRACSVSPQGRSSYFDATIW
jgi:hypothetical protein